MDNKSVYINDRYLNTYSHVLNIDTLNCIGFGQSVNWNNICNNTQFLYDLSLIKTVDSAHIELNCKNINSISGIHFLFCNTYIETFDIFLTSYDKTYFIKLLNMLSQYNNIKNISIHVFSFDDLHIYKQTLSYLMTKFDFLFGNMYDKKNSSIQIKYSFELSKQCFNKLVLNLTDDELYNILRMSSFKSLSIKKIDSVHFTFTSVLTLEQQHIVNNYISSYYCIKSARNY